MATKKVDGWMIAKKKSDGCLMVTKMVDNWLIAKDEADGKEEGWCLIISWWNWTLNATIGPLPIPKFEGGVY